MRKFRRAPVLALSLLGSMALAGASAPHSALQLKPGLWMFSNSTTVTGDTVFPDTMKTLPGKRAERLAELRRMLSQPTRERECTTQATLDTRIFNVGKNCKQAIVSNTPRRLEVVTECLSKIGSFTQETKQTLVMSSPMSVTTTIHSVSTKAGKTMTMDSVMSGHFVSPSCGNVHTIEQLP